MKAFRWLSLAIIMILLAGCASGNGTGPNLPFFPTPTPLPPPAIGITSVPNATPALESFLEALKQDDYASMYALLSKVSQEAITQEDFTTRYREALNTMSAASLDYEVFTATTNPYAAQVPFRITYHSALAGDISSDLSARLNLEDGQWRIQWDESLILSQLAGGNRLALDCKSPNRGEILDREGLPLVSTTEAVALGVDTGNVNFNNLYNLTFELWRLTGVNPETLANKIIASGTGWYIPVGTTSSEEGERVLDMGFSGLVTNPYTSRYYANSGSASQTLGYTLSISPENIDAYKRQGYCANDRVGWDGIEESEEDYLAGEHGGTLYIINPQGQIVSTLAQKEPQPASSVYLTLDKNLQNYAEQALGGFTGAVVVIERDTGRVLAMASSPGFDPNLFDPLNRNNAELLPELLNDPDQPLYNRAAQGQYPLGSVFKVITFSAALESGLFEPQTTYDCQYDFTEISGEVKHDWTWDHCQTRISRGQECNTSDSRPSGLLTLTDGLMRSCNPWFWHIGLDLYRNNRGGDIAKMARAFGLGSPTGIVGIEEEGGTISDPTDEIAAINQAIGQGDVLVTPLQVARFMAAIGNGGTLYRPQLIEKIVGPDSTVIESFSPEVVGTLPIQPERLKVLQGSMTSVIRDRRGTANFRIGSMNIAAAGKTGTAETNIPGSPHAWFAGYTFANIEGLPDIAVAVIVENIGEGSDYAAPIFRRVLEAYFYGSPQVLYWFESGFGVTRTPTPLGGIPTKTPRP